MTKPDTAITTAGLNQEVFEAECDDIAARRKADGCAGLGIAEVSHGPSVGLGLTGLALSGGGIRSAAFNLGVLQALNHHDVLKHIDYMCTVSGGGYIGGCLSSAYVKNPEFPFEHVPGRTEGRAIVHLRDNAQYLKPKGIVEYARLPALALRGVIINFLILLPLLLLLACVTVWIAAPYMDTAKTQISEAANERTAVAEAKQRIEALTLDVKAGISDKTNLQAAQQKLAQEERDLLVQASDLCLPWALPSIFMMLANDDHEICITVGDKTVSAMTQFRSFTVTIWAAGIFLIVCGIYPVIQFLTSLWRGGEPSWQHSDWASRALGGALLVVLVIAFIELQPAAILLFHSPTPGVTQFFGLDQSELTLWSAIVGLGASMFSGPLADKASTIAKSADKFGVAIADTSKITLYTIGLFGFLVFWLIYLDLCRRALFVGTPPIDLSGFGVWNWYTTSIGLDGSEVWKTYLAAVPVLGLLWLVVDVNRTSLHNFYRDRLSKTFLFGRVPTVDAEPMPSNDTQKLHDLQAARGPYLLVSTALNIQHSKTNNLRGRNAEFFLFSKNYIGSQLTGYRRTERYENDVDTHVDLGTAVAISGAAAAPNMGMITIKPLIFILAMLNVRLGYWLRNPRNVPPAEGTAKLEMATRPVRKLSPLNGVGPFYLLREMIARLDEDGRFVNLTDGAHIDGLGIYELIRRRCRFIVATDATWDEEHDFKALANVIRLALIDMGIHIRLSIDKIDAGGSGAHCALGKIEYGPDQTGTILFLKSSLSGDENPYIRAYKAKHADFPHESTGDQFFDEAQFEAYRALGYHIADGALRGDDPIQVYAGDTPEPPPAVSDSSDFGAWLTELDAMLEKASAPAAKEDELG